MKLETDEGGLVQWLGDTEGVKFEAEEEGLVRRLGDTEGVVKRGDGVRDGNGGAKGSLMNSGTCGGDSVLGAFCF